MEQISFSGLPEKPKQVPPKIEYGLEGNKVSRVIVYLAGFGVTVWLTPDGEVADAKAYPIVTGRAPSEFEVPSGLVEKARKQAIAIYHSHESAKERAEKKEKSAKQQKDLDFGNE